MSVIFGGRKESKVHVSFLTLQYSAFLALRRVIFFYIMSRLMKVFFNFIMYNPVTITFNINLKNSVLLTLSFSHQELLHSSIGLMNHSVSELKHNFLRNLFVWSFLKMNIFQLCCRSVLDDKVSHN